MLTPSFVIIVSFLALQSTTKIEPFLLTSNTDRWIKCEHTDFVFNFNIDDINEHLYSLEFDENLSIDSWSIGKIKANFPSDVNFGKISQEFKGEYNTASVDINLIDGTLEFNLINKPTNKDILACENKPKSKEWQAPCKDWRIPYQKIATCIAVSKKF